MKRRDWLKLMIGATALPVAWGDETEILPHPSRLKYPELRYDPPKPEQYRRQLAGGAIGFFVEDHQLPLISISLLVRTGSYLVPDQHLGLGALTGELMRAGGTKSVSAVDFDEETAFLATDIDSSIGTTSGRAGLNCLAKNLDASLKLFFDMLKNPGFDSERMELAVSRRLQAMERRNDRIDGILDREFDRLLRGDNHFSTRESTKATVESITRELMMEFHQRWFHPASFVFAVSGDFDTNEMTDRLGEALGDGWPLTKPNVPKVPAPEHTPLPGVYMVNKPDVNQGSVSLGHIGIQRDNPDHIAVEIMNQILGSGGFTSRIMARVRSDEGLAYSAGSSFDPGTYYRGTFRAGFQSKSPTCAEATALVLEEIERIRETKVSAEELETAKSYSVEVFPRFFATAAQVAGTFASDEYSGREKGYWEKYRARISAVSPDDVLRVAQQYIKPRDLVVIATGDVAAMQRGNPDKPQYKFENFDKDKKIQHIPLPDPLTMKYPVNSKPEA